MKTPKETLSPTFQKGKRPIYTVALPGGGEPTSELRDITCHMRSHSVTCHPTQVNAPRLIPAMHSDTRFEG